MRNRTFLVKYSTQGQGLKYTFPIIGQISFKALKVCSLSLPRLHYFDGFLISANSFDRQKVDPGRVPLLTWLLALAISHEYEYFLHFWPFDWWPEESWSFGCVLLLEIKNFLTSLAPAWQGDLWPPLPLCLCYSPCENAAGRATFFFGRKTLACGKAFF